MTRKKQDRPFIPQRPDDLTAEWFSQILATPGAVTHVAIDTIGTDIGFMGEVHRCRLTWADDAGGPGEPRVPDDARAHGQATAAPNDRPASVIVKVPTGNDENFALGDGLQLYEREITVYRELRNTLGLPMPGFLYGAMDPDPAPWLERPFMFLFDHLPIRVLNWLIAFFLKVASKSKRRYVLVLEDIANARPPSQLTGGSLDDALAALEVLARFHATNWMRHDAVADHRRIWPLDRGSRVYQASYVRNRQQFVERYGDRVGPEMMARLDAIQSRVPEVNGALAGEPWTLLHGDFRLDNILFRPDGELVVLDLQGLGYGRPAFDVAYFITTALTADHRAEEQRLLRTYHNALVRHGVTDYSWQQLIDDCSLTKEVLAHRIVGAADLLDTQMAGGDGSLIDVLQLRVLDWID